MINFLLYQEMSKLRKYLHDLCTGLFLDSSTCPERVLCGSAGRGGGHPGSSVTHIWKHSGGGWLLSWSRVPANCPVGIGHTHMHTQKIYCVCPGEVESCNVARSGCGWQTDWQAGRHDDPLSWNESVHRRHSLHRPRLSVCPSPCLFPLSHQLFLPSLTLWLAPSVFFFCVTAAQSHFAVTKFHLPQPMSICCLISSQHCMERKQNSVLPQAIMKNSCLKIFKTGLVLKHKHNWWKLLYARQPTSHILS